MKFMVGILSLSLSLSFASLASSGETKTFEYDGTQNSVELLLKGEKTHTEYRYETRRSTCYRTDMVGYRTICSGGGYNGPRGPHYPGPRTCYQQPVYRQVAYPCNQTVQVPYEVKDYDVEASVLVDVTNLAGSATPGERFSVTLDGDQLSLQAAGSKKFFLVQKKHDLRARMNGSVKMIDGLYAVELVEAAPVLRALKMTNISLQKPTLNFNLGPIEDRKHIGFSLTVVHKRALGSDNVIFDRELASSEVVLNSSSVATAAAVDTQKLGVSLNDRKYSLTARAFFKGSGPLLNKSQFGDDVETSRTLIYKN